MSKATAQRNLRVPQPTQALLAEPMFGFEHCGAVATAVAAFETAGCGFSDCLIVAKNQALGCAGTITFDLRMQGLTGAVPV